MVLMAMSAKSLAASPHGCPSLPHALAHLEGSETVRAYLRTDFFDKRWELMDAWGAFVMGSSTRHRPESQNPAWASTDGSGGPSHARRPSKVDRCAGPDAGAYHFVYYFR